MPSWSISASSPKSFLLYGWHRLKETIWWVPNQRALKTVYIPSGKLTGWLARLWLSPRSIESPRPARKWRHPRRRLLELQSLTAWGPRPPWLRGLTQEPPFRVGAGRAHQRPFQEVHKKPGKASSSTTTRQRWRVPGGGLAWQTLHTLMHLTIRLLKSCDCKAITLVPVHLPGVHNIQVDSLSRVGQTLTTEWTMAMESLRPVFAKWGEPRIDLFATFANRQHVKFVSPYPDPRAEWTDAMSMPWDNGRGLLYAFPPFKMVPQVLQKIAQSPGVKVILIAQLQPAASWFPELMNLSQEDLIPLFVEGQDLLTQDVWTGWLRLVTSDRQIYTRGNSPGHPEGEGSFQGSCQHDFKVPSGIFTANVRIPLVKIRGVL